MLSKEEREAFVKLAPLSVTISEFVDDKCKLLGLEGQIFSSLILAELLVKSDFLRWPLSKVEYGNGKSARYANNLAKIELSDDWKGKYIEYNRIKYKTYRDWLHFASDYSDIICFTCPHILKHKTLEAQVRAWNNPNIYIKDEKLVLL